MNKSQMLKLALPLLAATATGAARADDALANCRGIAEAMPRLACYDAIGAAPAAAPAAATAARTVAPPPVAAARGAEQGFGLQPKPAPADADAIELTIAGAFDGWRADDRIAMSNGQVWQVIDGSSGVTRSMTDAKVTIRRGALGAFFLEIPGSNRSPKVRRLR
ncbi:MAG: hypothetical protein KGN16_16345 [Burkholderiales bacterium]|nr:hypothetical protein [Burkholderiales bacterium]